MSALPPGWAALDQAQRDAAYNNGSATPDRDAVVAAREAASMAFRAAHPALLDLPYGDGARTKWDLFPADSPAAPCLAFIHGGWWQYNKREDFAAIATGLRAHGWSVALPGYTLAPDAPLGQIVAEIHQALDWLVSEGAARGMTGPIILSGWSAGAHLAAMALDHPSVTAGLAISGVYELAPLRDIYVNDALRLTEADVASLSPIRLPASAKRLVLAYGTAELPEMQRQARDFHAMRAAAHRPGALIPIAGADHFRILDALTAPDGELTRAALALV
jgi:arylformamidase